MADPVLNLAGRVIRVAKPWITDSEVHAVTDCMLSGQVSAGPMVEQFERDFSAAHDRRFGVACNSGTTALRLALAALDIKLGDKVCLPTLTMVAVANVIVEAGAIPVFVDSDELGVGNIDVTKAITACFQERCAAVILPHLYGTPIDYCEHDFPCPVIEDCSEIHYGRFRGGASIGTRSTLACFSFYGNKIVTTGEGGMILGTERLLEERLRRLRAHAFSEREHFSHTELAFGMRMTEMSGALGLAQHRRRVEILSRRKQIAEWYVEALDDMAHVEPYDTCPGKVWWVFPVLATGNRRDSHRAALAAAGVETRTFFRPLHRQRHLLRYSPADAQDRFRNADRRWQQGFYLPLYPEMTREDVEYIAGIMRSV